MKYKVGDRVRIIKKIYSFDVIGEIFTIVSVSANLFYRIDSASTNLVYRKVDGSDFPYPYEDIELVSEAIETPRLKKCTNPLQPNINLTQKVMSSIQTFAKNLLLSGDEKLLREQGLKGSCGDYTEDAEAIVMAKLCADNEAYLVEIATNKKEEEKKK